MAQPAPDGVTVRLFKGDRGARNGKYLMTLEMDTVANRDTTFPTEGSHDDSPAIQAWQQENPAAAEAWGRFSEYGGTTEVFTDYVAIDQLIGLSPTVERPGTPDTTRTVRSRAAERLAVASLTVRVAQAELCSPSPPH